MFFQNLILLELNQQQQQQQQQQQHEHHHGNEKNFSIKKFEEMKKNLNLEESLKTHSTTQSSSKSSG